MDITLTYISGKNNKYWKIADNLSVTLSDGYKITIPKGMETDLSSVPKFLWNFLPPFGDFLIAALVHDYLYMYDYRRAELGDKLARKFADREMLQLSNKHNPKNKIDNYLRYLGVRLFGAKIYKR